MAVRETKLTDTSHISLNTQTLRELGSDALANLVAEMAGCDSRAMALASSALTRVGPAEAPADEPYMVGSSPAMAGIYRMLRRYATSSAPVMVTGESGTGKELAALAIHERSAQAKGPFIPVNCAGLPATLVASELFGHEKGSFTGASQRKIGRIEAADGGTVLLDEIGDLPLEMQPQLLRFLQEGTIDRVGSTRPVAVNVRVIAATNKDLAAEVKAGRFREDLFYRLNVLSMELPPLRDRGDDVELLARFFLDQFAAEADGRAHRLSAAALRSLAAHSWPGNVRELICCLRKATVLAESDEIGPDDLGLEPVTEDSAPALTSVEPLVLPLSERVVTLAEAKDDIEAALLRKALDRNAGKITAAAGELGVSRVTLYRLIEKHRLNSSAA